MYDTRVMTRAWVPAAALGLLFALGGCANMGGMGTKSSGDAGATTGTASAPAQANYQPVSDIPIPPGTKINTERSLILGSPDQWIGKIVLVMDRPTTQAYSYYLEQMPSFGWEQITAVQGKTSVMTFT
ncbi:MAG: hypothetical protein KIT73_11090, partial [Burkholderiales bacterium]|nr:hypothetical protein [Burkholderiales bacterium]